MKRRGHNWVNEQGFDMFTEQEKKELLAKLRKEAWFAWRIFFVIHIFMGGHVLVQGGFVDVGLIKYSLILSAGAAIMSTVTLILAALAIMVVGGIVFGLNLWWENRKA